MDDLAALLSISKSCRAQHGMTTHAFALSAFACDRLAHKIVSPFLTAGALSLAIVVATKAQSKAAASKIPYEVGRRPARMVLLQLVAIDDRALSARYVVKDATLDKRVYSRMAEQDQRGTIIIAARIARDLPPLPRAVGRSSAACPMPPSWTPLASMPTTSLNA